MTTDSSRMALARLLIVQGNNDPEVWSLALYGDARWETVERIRAKGVWNAEELRGRWGNKREELLRALLHT